MVSCLHELVGLTSKTTKKAWSKKGKTVAGPNQAERKAFEWMPEHQMIFSVLKEALVTAPFLGYPDLYRESVLETNASLQGLGVMLFQHDENTSSMV